MSDGDNGTESIEKISDTELHMLRIIGIHFVVKEKGNVNPYLLPGPLLRGKVMSITYSECVFVTIGIVVYAELGLDFHQILQRQLLWVKERIALRWVVMLPPIRSLSDKRNSTLI